jgi:acetolactate synthase-1/2/3 large subunit
VDELDGVYRQALAVTDRPALVHVHTEPTENCFPMWPAGQSIDTMIAEDPKYTAKSTKKKS